ncbi:MAG: cytochrome c-type biogenesis protein CcmH [Alphaproteobacteria bacterium]|nr:cytochrome c-type biogenesis protein CcmH [Alphaproteobacteria bacterium]
MKAKHRTVVLAAILAVLALTSAPGDRALAVKPDEMLADAAMEARARAISKGLRCLVCQNQSIDDSDAGLARDLRVLVRQRLTAGDSDEAVFRFVVDRYGDFVLLKPPMKPVTYILWFGPLLILLGAIAVLVFFFVRRRGTGITASPTLSEDDRRRLEALLGEDEDERGER